MKSAPVIFFLILSVAFAAMAMGQHPIRRIPDPNTWEGTYTFLENGGRTAGGTSILIEHKITIYRVSDRLMAKIDADGYQTAVAIACETAVSKRRIDLLYKNRREGDTSSQKFDSTGGVRDRYRRGELLLTLEKPLSSRSSRVTTYWVGYQPVEMRSKNGRFYFRKVS